MKIFATILAITLSLIALPKFAHALNADFSWMKDNSVDQKSLFVNHNLNVNKVAVAIYGKYVHINGKKYRANGTVDLSRRVSLVNLSGSYKYTYDTVKYHEYVLGVGANVTKYFSANLGYKQDLDQNFAKVDHKILVSWATFNYANRDLKLFWKTSWNVDRTLDVHKFDNVGVVSLNMTKHVYVAYNFEDIRDSKLQRIAVGFNL